VRKNKVTVWVEALSVIMRVINPLGLRRHMKKPYAILMVEHAFGSRVIRVYSEAEYKRVTLDIGAMGYPVLAYSRDMACQPLAK
jgi:hypothetical protein